MTQTEKDALLKLVGAWFDSAVQPESTDHQLIISRESLVKSRVNGEFLSVNFTIKAVTLAAAPSVSISKIVQPTSPIINPNAPHTTDGQ